MRRSTKHSTTDSPTGDQEDEHVNLQQKIAVSKEMTGLLERRLKEMHETGTIGLHFCKLVCGIFWPLNTRAVSLVLFYNRFSTSARAKIGPELWREEVLLGC